MTTYEEIALKKSSSKFDSKVVDLVDRLETCRVSADVNHPVNPSICKEVALFLKKLLVALHEYGDAYEVEL